MATKTPAKTARKAPTKKAAPVRMLPYEAEIQLRGIALQHAISVSRVDRPVSLTSWSAGDVSPKGTARSHESAEKIVEVAGKFLAFLKG